MESLERFSEDCRFRRMIFSINIKYFSRPSSQILFLKLHNCLKNVKIQSNLIIFLIKNSNVIKSLMFNVVLSFHLPVGTILWAIRSLKSFLQHLTAEPAYPSPSSSQSMRVLLFIIFVVQLTGRYPKDLKSCPVAVLDISDNCQPLCSSP